MENWYLVIPKFRDHVNVDYMGYTNNRFLFLKYIEFLEFCNYSCYDCYEGLTRTKCLMTCTTYISQYATGDLYSTKLLELRSIQSQSTDEFIVLNDLIYGRFNISIHKSLVSLHANKSLVLLHTTSDLYINFAIYTFNRLWKYIDSTPNTVYLKKLLVLLREYTLDINKIRRENQGWFYEDNKEIDSMNLWTIFDESFECKRFMMEELCQLQIENY